MNVDIFSIEWAYILGLMKYIDVIYQPIDLILFRLFGVASITVCLKRFVVKLASADQNYRFFSALPLAVMDILILFIHITCIGVLNKWLVILLLSYECGRVLRGLVLSRNKLSSCKLFMSVVCVDKYMAGILLGRYKMLTSRSILSIVSFLLGVTVFADPRIAIYQILCAGFVVSVNLLDQLNEYKQRKCSNEMLTQSYRIRPTTLL